MQSNQSRHHPASAATIAAGVLVLLAVTAWLASKAWAPAGVLVVVAAFMGCGLTRRHQQRTAKLPRPAPADLPTLRDPAQLAA